MRQRIGARHQGDRLGARGVGLGPADHAVLAHPLEDVRLPFAGAMPVLVGVEVRRRLGEPGQHRRLGDGQMLHVLAEVDLGGRLHPVGAVPEVDVVQVDVEDSLFRKLALDADAENELLGLANERSFRRQEEHAGDLLGDGGGALPHAAGDVVLPGGADDADRIEAVMGAEATVLGGDEGVLHVERDAIQRDKDALFQEELTDELTVGRIHARGAGRLVGDDLVEVRR